MRIALGWWEGPFYCEFRDDSEWSGLSIFKEGDIVWRQPLQSATAAFRRAREVTLSLGRARKR